MKGSSQLPIDGALPRLLDALAKGPAAVLQAPTGSGKTTRVPPALLHSGLLGKGQLILLQPRRVAARACAAYMAGQSGDKLGGLVGYQIRFDRRCSRQTRILVMTEGILTRRLIDDPLLEGVSGVVLDEFHERSIHSDLALACLREVLTIRDDLKLVVMSATLDAEPVARFLGNCPVISVKLRRHPLNIRYMDTGAGEGLGPGCKRALRNLLEDPDDDGGHILTFLPGAPEIRSVLRYLGRASWPLDLLPLHGSLSPAEQDAALAPSARRRMILATNIAETSLTIEGVTAVIDSGFHKQVSQDPARGIDRLDRVRISRAGADQRAGRAGRTGPGRVVRLWGRDLQAMLSAQEKAEIQRVDLAATLLHILDFHGPDLRDFPFFEAPPPRSLEIARTTLKRLGAIDSQSRLTSKGKRLVGLPLHPRLASILDRAAEAGRIREGALLCAYLNESAGVPAQTDWVDQLQQLWAAFNGARGSRPSDRRVLQAARQIFRQAEKIWPRRTAAPVQNLEKHLGPLLLAGYADRLCKARGKGLGIMVGGRGVAYDAARVPDDFELFLALDLMERGDRRVACKAGLILPLTLDDVRRNLKVTERIEAVFDPQTESVAGMRRVLFEDLVLWEREGAKLDGEEAARVLAAEAARRMDAIFKPGKKDRQLLYRLRFAAKCLPEESWPDVSEEGIIRLLPEVCLGKRKLGDLRRQNWSEVFLARLSWQQRRLLDREVPEAWTAPTGSRIAIDYQPALEPEGLPVLAVRLQEVFGLADTPTVARGRTPLLCHLLAPNMRPAQITRDLRGFWNTTYAEVRKELRQRYPKHAWPEDPWSAKPVRGVPRKRRPPPPK